MKLFVHLKRSSEIHPENNILFSKAIFCNKILIQRLTQLISPDFDMSFPENKICLTIFYDSEEFKLQTYHGEYRDLKCLIQDRLYTEDFGECGGMGRCGTCLVEVIGLKGEAALKKRNESTTLGRLSSIGSEIRLACQIRVDDSLSNLVIRVLEK